MTHPLETCAEKLGEIIKKKNRQHPHLKVVVRLNFETTLCFHLHTFN